MTSAATKTDIIRISLITSDPQLSESLSSILRKAGQDICLVTKAHTAKQALNEFPSLKSDLVLMDLNLPDIRGFECVTLLTSLMPEIPIVMITEIDDTESVFQALAAGAIGYIYKPIDPVRLLQIVDEVRAGGGPRSSVIARLLEQKFNHSAPATQIQVESLLAPREREILRLLAKGCLQKEIADQIGIAYTTVRTLTTRIYKKLRVNSRAQAVAKFLGKFD